MFECINEPPPLSGTASVNQDVDCYGFASGQLIFLVDQAQPGIPAYQYSLNNGLSYQSSNIFTALLGDSTSVSYTHLTLPTNREV